MLDMGLAGITRLSDFLTLRSGLPPADALLSPELSANAGPSEESAEIRHFFGLHPCDGCKPFSHTG
jgi:hypothetical protein